jgi:hypothetical protein
MRREKFQNPVTIAIRIEKIERDMAQYAGINVKKNTLRRISTRRKLETVLEEDIPPSRRPDRSVSRMNTTLQN